MILKGKTTGFFVGLFVLALYCAFEGTTREPVEHRDESPRPLAVSAMTTSSTVRLPQALGVASCAAQACHGNGSQTIGPLNVAELAAVGDDRSWQSSFFRWHNFDKHSRAWDVLKNERSQRMIHRLTEGKSSDATVDSRCLACHTNPTLADRSDEVARNLHREGVSCEACHGNAENWRDKHIEWPAKAPRDRDYDSGQMTKLYDVGVRAETCAGCHVGAPASEGKPLRDVNHDLIAAGHPRLNFELATYSRMMPPHWQEKDRSLEGHPARPPGYEAQIWLVGQAACAEADLNLLAARAETPRWPELAEYNCASCHHQLQPNGWHRPSAGSLIWTFSWSLEPKPTDSHLLQATKATAEVAKQMALRKPAAVADAARMAANDWHRARNEFAAVMPNDAMGREILGRLPLKSLDPHDWDQSARYYYGLTASENAYRQLRNGKEEIPNHQVESSMLKLLNLLRLPREKAPGDAEALRDEFGKWFK